MYAIREEAQYARLCVTLSGRVPTDEALRAIRQAAVLLQTDGLREVVCDVTMLERGPGRLVSLAVLLASEFPANARLAIRSGEHQLRLSQRFLRFSGLGSRVRCFTDESFAEQWLTDQRSTVRPVTTEARHAELKSIVETRIRSTQERTERMGPAA